MQSRRCHQSVSPGILIYRQVTSESLRNDQISGDKINEMWVPHEEEGSKGLLELVPHFSWRVGKWMNPEHIFKVLTWISLKSQLKSQLTARGFIWLHGIRLRNYQGQYMAQRLCHPWNYLGESDFASCTTILSIIWADMLDRTCSHLIDLGSILFWKLSTLTFIPLLLGVM